MNMRDLKVHWIWTMKGVLLDRCVAIYLIQIQDLILFRLYEGKLEVYFFTFAGECT